MNWVSRCPGPMADLMLMVLLTWLLLLWRSCQCCWPFLGGWWCRLELSQCPELRSHLLRLHAYWGCGCPPGLILTPCSCSPHLSESVNSRPVFAIKLLAVSNGSIWFPDLNLLLMLKNQRQWTYVCLLGTSVPWGFWTDFLNSTASSTVCWSLGCWWWSNLPCLGRLQFSPHKNLAFCPVLQFGTNACFWQQSPDFRRETSTFCRVIFTLLRVEKSANLSGLFLAEGVLGGHSRRSWRSGSCLRQSSNSSLPCLYGLFCDKTISEIVLRGHHWSSEVVVVVS